MCQTVLWSKGMLFSCEDKECCSTVQFLLSEGKDQKKYSFTIQLAISIAQEISVRDQKSWETGLHYWSSSDQDLSFCSWFYRSDSVNTCKWLSEWASENFVILLLYRSSKLKTTTMSYLWISLSCNVSANKINKITVIFL